MEKMVLRVCSKSGLVIIAVENKNRNTWKLGIVSDLIKGKDDVVRGEKVCTAKRCTRKGDSATASTRVVHRRKELGT